MGKKKTRRVLVTLDGELWAWLLAEGRKRDRSAAYLLNQYGKSAMRRLENQRERKRSGGCTRISAF